MKKILLITSVLILLCVLLVSCNKLIDDENSKGAVQNEASLTDLSVPLDFSDYNVSVTEENSETEISIPSESSTIPEDNSENDQGDESNTENLTVWYGDKEMEQWFVDYKAGYEDPSLAWMSGDQIHVGYYFVVNGIFIDYISQEKFDVALELFSSSGINIGILCDYFDISKEDYIALCLSTLQKVPFGQIPEVVCANMEMYRYDAWFAEEYWNHPDFLYSNYEQPEVQSYYTSNPGDKEHIRVYYNIDHKLIEHVGVDAFENWLDRKDKEERNILEFVKDFGITKDTFKAIYTGDRVLPYNPDYLFGTPEMQDEYFKVHPLD